MSGARLRPIRPRSASAPLRRTVPTPLRSLHARHRRFSVAGRARNTGSVERIRPFRRQQCPILLSGSAWPALGRTEWASHRAGAANATRREGPHAAGPGIAPQSVGLPQARAPGPRRQWRSCCASADRHRCSGPTPRGPRLVVLERTSLSGNKRTLGPGLLHDRPARLCPREPTIGARGQPYFAGRRKRGPSETGCPTALELGEIRPDPSGFLPRTSSRASSTLPRTSLPPSRSSSTPTGRRTGALACLRLRQRQLPPVQGRQLELLGEPRHKLQITESNSNGRATK